MNKLIRHLSLGAILAAAVVLPFGAGAQTAVKIGAVLPLTGPASEIGNEQKRGIELALDVARQNKAVPGHDVEAIFEDNQAKADVAVTAFNKLVRLNGTQVVITGYSGPALAMAPLATRQKILLLNGGAQSNALADASPYLINTAPLFRSEIAAIVEYLRKDLNVKTAAMIYQNDAQGNPAHESFVKAFVESGGRMVAEEPVPFGETNFRSPLAKIAAAKPDAIFAVISQGFVQLSEQKDQLGLKVIMASNTSANQPTNLASNLMQGWYHTQLRLNAPKEILDLYKKKYGIEMGFYARQYYNTTFILLQAMKKTLEQKKELTGANLRETILGVKNFDGIDGPLVFDSNTVSMPIDVNVIRNNKTEAVKSISVKN
jgi:branched-chain amino acid transport system substrate-binding protein